MYCTGICVTLPLMIQFIPDIILQHPASIIVNTLCTFTCTCAVLVSRLFYFIISAIVHCRIPAQTYMFMDKPHNLKLHIQMFFFFLCHSTCIFNWLCHIIMSFHKFLMIVPSNYEIKNMYVHRSFYML